MYLALLFSCALTQIAPDQPAAEPPALAQYQALRDAVGRDADAQVKLALWCEAHGLEAERVKHLASAVIANPRHAMARGLLGLVEQKGRWQRPEAIVKQTNVDRVIAEYHERREAAKQTPASQWALALWCKENDLPREASAHFTAVIKLDPKRDDAWRQLGYKKVKGRWLTDEEIAAEKAEAALQKEANKRWKPLLSKARDNLNSKDQSRRAQVEAILTDVTDPRAVPSVWAVFVDEEEAHQAIAVRLLGNIDDASASRALALMAIMSPSKEIQRTAIETLKRRDPREYANILIAMMRETIAYEVKPVGGPGMPGALLIDGKETRLERQYLPASMPQIRNLGALIARFGSIELDEDGYLALVRRPRSQMIIAPPTQNNLEGALSWSPIPVLPQYNAPISSAAVAQQLARNLPNQTTSVPSGTGTPTASNALQSLPQLNGVLPGQQNQGMGSPFRVNRPMNVLKIGRAFAETEKNAAMLQQQLEADVANLEQYNKESREGNQQVADILNETTGQSLDSEVPTWNHWWNNQLGYAQKTQYAPPKPTMVEQVTQPLPPIAGLRMNGNGYLLSTSCFGAGTLVHTSMGTRAIEQLKEGDLVLSQDIKTGELAYRPILVVHHNQPSPTYRIKLNNESIVSSHFHRFWKAGKGWVMARDLKPGDRVRTMGGVVGIEAIEPDEVQPVFNLDIAENCDFFVGEQGALVHDNSLPDLRLIPFDAPPSLVSSVDREPAEAH